MSKVEIISSLTVMTTPSLRAAGGASGAAAGACSGVAAGAASAGAGAAGGVVWARAANEIPIRQSVASPPRPISVIRFIEAEMSLSFCGRGRPLACIAKCGE
jgi:hypothetical protein